MKAAYIDETGTLDSIKIGDVEPPELKEGEVLVRVKAAGVNPVDAAIVQGYMEGRLPHQFPMIPGWDLSGVIEERGHGARRFDTGDEVYGYARRPTVQWGTFAEHVVIPESYLAKNPKSVSHKEAGAIPLVGLTAYQSLYDAGNLQEGQTVLILGASGGVGTFAIQLAKARGATVIGIASEKNHDYMKELGADETITYEDTDISEAVLDATPGGVDLIFDCSRGDALQRSLKTLKNGGKLVSITKSNPDIDSNIDHEYVFVEPNSKQLDHLRELVDDDKISVPVSKTFSLDQAAEALKQIQTLHTKGKIVIEP
ncbi:MAG: NADP-dependent oxidoreductase [Balneolaceae bacterium]|nr:NADP-dependent oxidoreductase [Balneolaceae bacterium]